ncbi:MAG: NIPSNAP family protein [Gammaproteobacteria bacterium]|nr:NIPSNAP family protein [Gammaproteobacteria bacterium]
MIHELRIYHCLPGRLPALNRRFENVTLKMWEKHGIRQAGFWTVLIGENNHDLYYLLEWKDLAERERKWNAFQADPQWQAARAESEKDGPILAHITNYILAPTAYSKMK